MLENSLFSYLSYEELFKKGGSASLHHINLRILATERFKIVKEIFPEIRNKVFPFCSRRNTNLRQIRLLFYFLFTFYILYQWCSYWQKITFLPRVNNRGIDSLCNKKLKLPC